MSLQNEMRRTRITNLEYAAKRFRGEIECLSKTISFNLDCGLTRPEELSIGVIDGQWDELKAKWGELNVALSEIARLQEELK